MLQTEFNSVYNFLGCLIGLLAMADVCRYSESGIIERFYQRFILTVQSCSSEKIAQMHMNVGLQAAKCILPPSFLKDLLGNLMPPTRIS